MINLKLLSMLKVGYNISDEHKGFNTHHEKPERINYCVDELKKSLPKEKFIKNTVPKTTTLKLLLDVHENEYIQSIIHAIPRTYICRKCKKNMDSNLLTFSEFIEQFKKCKTCEENITEGDIFCHLDSDTYFTGKTFGIVLEGIGVLKILLDEFKTNLVKHGFALIRPPGHHCANKGKGFCVVNNVVIASKYAQKIGYKKIFILDIDFHHGDGTQELIKDMEDIYFCSLHGYGTAVYPGTGSRKENNEKILNIPLEIEACASSRTYINDDYYLNIIDGEVKEFINKCSPSVIIVSCGFDGHQDDPLEGFNLTDDAYSRITNSLKQYDVPLLFVTEGGYSVNAISRCVNSMVNILNSV